MWMSQREQQRIVDNSGFTHQHLPFKYLGVPICAKRINVTQCEVLVDKMIAKIKVWSSRNLSYTARVQLVNAVLMSIHQYWAQVLILPQQVLHRIIQVCRSFLWSGQYFTLKAGNVAWEKVCTPKSAGGLGFRDVFKWNIACVGRYIWAISTKQDSVWLKWVHSVYLKGGDWWEYTPTTSSSWYWRKLCQVKEQLKQSFTQAEFRNIRQYSVKKVYEILMGEQERVHGDRVILNSRMNLPKHRFISWLAIQGKLQTTAKLVVMGISTTNTCLLCGSYKEDHLHLFFKCHFSPACLKYIKEWLHCSAQTDDLHQLITWIQNNIRTNKFQKQVYLAGVAAMVYMTWHSRNKVFWEQCAPSISSVCKQVISIVKARIRVVLPKKITRKDGECFLSL